MERDYTKYRSKSKTWGLNSQIVDEIIMTALDRLVKELMDDTPLTINRHFKDHRTPEEYYADIIEGWLVEDLLVEWFKKQKRCVFSAGSDKNRKIQRQNSKKITTKMDFIETLPSGETKNIEVQMSREKRSIFHVKKSKGDRILLEKGEIMFILLPDDTFFMVTDDIIKKSELKPNPAWGGKICYWITPEKFYKMGEE